jgi:glycine/D-amino acid oxidase-like deaminating enzyme
MEKTVMGMADPTDSSGKGIQASKLGLSPDYDVTIIGAGPYGLSAAAYLKAKGLGVRIFGEPMEFWADKMPAGMLLRSPRVASTIADPKGSGTLEAYEAANGVKPVAPLPLRTFVDYGRWFQKNLVTGLGTGRPSKSPELNLQARPGEWVVADQPARGGSGGNRAISTDPADLRATFPLAGFALLSGCQDQSIYREKGRCYRLRAERARMRGAFA